MQKKQVAKIPILVTIILFFLISPQLLLAEEEQLYVHILIRDEKLSILEVNKDLPEAGVTSVIDNSGALQEVNARSVLGLLYNLDITENAFEISEIVYYPSFNALYLKCITLNQEKKCDNWLYEIDGAMPSVGMDNFILSGNENIEIFFNPFFWGSDEEESSNEITEEPAAENIEQSTVSPSKERVVRSSGSRRVVSEQATFLKEERQVMQVESGEISTKTRKIESSKDENSVVIPKSVNPKFSLLATVEEAIQDIPLRTIIISMLVFVIIVYFFRRLRA